jgi:hypothetical protein
VVCRHLSLTNCGVPRVGKAEHRWPRDTNKTNACVCVGVCVGRAAGVPSNDTYKSCSSYVVSFIVNALAYAEVQHISHSEEIGDILRCNATPICVYILTLGRNILSASSGLTNIFQYVYSY